MIIEFNQIGLQPNPDFEGRLNNTVIITGRGSTRKHQAFLKIHDDIYKLSNSIHREKINGKTATQITDIFMNNQKIGCIYPDVVPQKKFLIFSFGYGFFEFQFKDKHYQFYEVALGADKHYICIYENNKTIAIIYKTDLRITFRDKYILYIEDETNLEAVSIAALYFDCIMYPDYTEIGGEVVKDNDVCLTVQKELIDKYDESFIKKVKKMDGLIE